MKKKGKNWKIEIPYHAGIVYYGEGGLLVLGALEAVQLGQVLGQLVQE